MTNRLWCFHLVITLCVGLSCAKFYEKDSVHFNNSLNPNNVLKVHCISEQDDFGDHFLSLGQTYDFSFYESIKKTKVDCDLWKGPDFRFHAKFRAYEGGGFIVHYGKKNFWDAREDGIYFTHGKELPKLEYKWSSQYLITPVN
ncbi:hypothetical protein N665_0040s0031 [Sinapis alba]|nr:hypothetical protein N665_0040s0031 [Sinapis alba]